MGTGKGIVSQTGKDCLLRATFTVGNGLSCMVIGLFLFISSSDSSLVVPLSLSAALASCFPLLNLTDVHVLYCIVLYLYLFKVGNSTDIGCVYTYPDRSGYPDV